jgi:hypothetical protein
MKMNRENEGHSKERYQSCAGTSDQSATDSKEMVKLGASVALRCVGWHSLHS